MKGLIFAFVVSAFFITANAQDDTKQSRKEEKKAEQIKKVGDLIENNTFVFNALKAVPLCGDPVSIEYLYSLKIENSIVSSYLPFYGIETEYKIENSPLVFTNSYTGYSSSKENDKYKINFNVPVEGDNIKLQFQVSKFGFAKLQVTSNNYQGISFIGFIDEIEPTVISSY